MSQLEPNILQLVWFIALWGVCCLGFLQLAGMYPLESRASGISALLVIASTVLWAILLACTFLYAITELRWTSIVIVAGLLFLFIPEPFQAIPEKWRNSSTGVFVTGLVFAVTLVLFSVFASNPVTALLKPIA
jgi:drug/metabolite transporter (DMT)-like permease